MDYKNVQFEDLKLIKENDEKFLSMGENQKQEYLTLYSLYRYWFSKYIINLLDLKKYDEEIGSLFPHDATIKEDNMDFFQYYTSNDLNYLYIRNDIYIDRLNEEEIQFLKSRLLLNHVNYDEEVEAFINKTYHNCIFNDIKGNNEKCITFYGPNTSSYMANNDSLIIGLRYDEKVLNAKNSEDNFYMHDLILDNLYSLIERFKSDLEKKHIDSVNVIEYNKYSIIKRFNNIVDCNQPVK